MKPLLIASLLALAAPAADAGDVKFRFGFGKHRHGKSVRVGFEYRDGHRHRRGHRYRHRHRQRDCYCERVWIPGCYERVARRVWVPGCRQRVFRPAVYRYRYDACGRRVRYCVRPAGWHWVTTRGHWETRYVRVHRPGHWEYRCNTPGHRH